ncbi:hypothetical protein AVEN_222402-1 [Araneus ventricosus]|uniref:Uncharacterized protein n=1 Tax=Araneus ventricosus TaxID=182803 RepID=A0A4Y2RIN3_ARAVE|nr:hypothetical protein AVEN_222402-1 [Araneus ventricosus]
MARHTTTENGVIILLLIFFISLVNCESAGTKLGYKPGTFKDFVSEKTRGKEQLFDTLFCIFNSIDTGTSQTSLQAKDDGRPKSPEYRCEIFTPIKCD